MGKIERFEDIDCWKEASELAIKVSKMLSNFIAYLISVKGVKG
ncbi:hypothetical protein ACFLUD_04345 [Chloroflexota bacterium]